MPLHITGTFPSYCEEVSVYEEEYSSCHITEIWIKACSNVLMLNPGRDNSKKVDPTMSTDMVI